MERIAGMEALRSLTSSWAGMPPATMTPANSMPSVSSARAAMSRLDLGMNIA